MPLLRWMAGNKTRLPIESRLKNAFSAIKASFSFTLRPNQVDYGLQ
jgi:hypothetical protein